MTDWSASLYLKFEDERTRPARDLLAQVPQFDFSRVADLGCGPGNSTALLVERFPDAEIVGVDSSPDMLRQARERLPARRFVEADVATWRPDAGTDLIFANALFQWVPDRQQVLRRLAEALPERGVLAVQMPDNLDEPSHALMREVAETAPFAKALASGSAAREAMPSPAEFYDLLSPVCRRIDIWHTAYNHILDGPGAIVEWVEATGLRPYLDPLDAEMREAYRAAYTAMIAEAYPRRADGKVILGFPRLFIVAVR